MVPSRSIMELSAWMSPMVPIPMVINSKSGIVPKIITKSSTIQNMGTTSEFFFLVA